MARIPTYTIDTVFNDNDLLLGTDGSTTALETKNFKIGGLKDYIIDQFVDPDATDFHIPVFHNSGTKITDSIIRQNTYPNGTSITLGGDLSVTGSGTFGSSVIITGTVYADGEGTVTKKLHVRGADGNSGILKLNCENNSHGVQIQGPPHSAGANYTLVLPNDTGSAGQQLTTDGTGVLSWSAGSAIVGSGSAGRLPIWDGTNSLTDSPIRKTTDAAGANVLNFQDSAGVGSKVSFGLPGSVYLGANAGQADTAVVSNAAFAQFNIGIGDEALKTQVQGTNPVSGDTEPGANIGIGYKALTSTTTGTNNVGIGIDALSTNVTGYNNVAISKNALGSTINATQSISDNNTSIGIGFSAGNPSVNQPAPVAHIGDTFVGHQAGADQIYSLSTKNVYLGFRAGRNAGDVNSVMSSVDNVVIGNAAGLNIDGPDGSPINFHRNIFIGKNAGGSTFGSNIKDNIILGSRGTDPLYLQEGNVIFHTGGFGNDIGIPSGTGYDGAVSNNFVLGSNIKVFGNKNIVLNPTTSTDFNNGISLGESDFRPTSGNWNDDFSENVIIGGGGAPGIKISTTGAGQNTTQNIRNTLITSDQIQLQSYGIYDAQHNSIIGSSKINLKSNLGTTGNGNHIRSNVFLNSAMVTVEGKFEGNTLINFKGSSTTLAANFGKQIPGSSGSSAGNLGNVVFGKGLNQDMYHEIYVGANNNIIGPMGSGVEVMGDGNLLFGVSNIQLWNASHSNLAFGQYISAGNDPNLANPDNKRAQRSLLFGYNIDVANNQNLQNSLVAGSNTTFESGDSTQIQNSIALGTGLIGKNSNAAYFGKNNTSSSKPLEELLVIGCGFGSGSSARKNALEVLQNTSAESSTIGAATVVMPQTVTADFADDTAAAAAGIPIGLDGCGGASNPATFFSKSSERETLIVMLLSLMINSFCVVDVCNIICCEK